VPTESVKTGEPIEVGSCSPSVQENHGRCAYGARNFAHEGAPATREVDFVTLRKVSRGSVGAANHAAKSLTMRSLELDTQHSHGERAVGCLVTHLCATARTDERGSER
jgi:hypothetical protein